MFYVHFYMQFYEILVSKILLWQKFKKHVFTSYYFQPDLTHAIVKSGWKWKFLLFLFCSILKKENVSNFTSSGLKIRLSSVTLVSQHYYNTMTMTLVSWRCNTIATLYQIWCQWKWGINLENHQFWSKLEKSSWFLLVQIWKIIIFAKFWENNSFSKVWKTFIFFQNWKKSTIVTKIWKIIIFGQILKIANY